MSKQIYDSPELLQEQMLTLKDACARFPLPVALSTLERFVRNGSNGNVLESIKIGGRRMTSAEAVQRFIIGGLNLPPDTPQEPKRVGMTDAELEAARIRFKLPKPGKDGKTYEELQEEKKQKPR